MHIAVIGSGYVGLVTGACFAEFGDDVTCVDVDAEKVARLSRGEMTLYEPGLNQLVQKNLQAGRLRFTTDIGSATEQSLVVFLAVGTPPKTDGSARSEEHTSELQSRGHLVCRLLLEKKKLKTIQLASAVSLPYK